VGIFISKQEVLIF